jgi:hypothetical protein
MAIGNNNTAGRVVEELSPTKLGGRVASFNTPPTGGGGDSGVVPHYHTLTTQNITDKHFQLAPVPTNLGEISLDIVGGVPQNLGTDYTVNGLGVLSWNTLGMDGLVIAGDILIIYYL